MELSPGAVVISNRDKQIRKEEADGRGLVPLVHGAYLRRDHIDASVKPWEVRILVAQARVLALDRIWSGPRPVFTGEGAMVMLGIDTWWNNPNILYRREVASRQTTTLRSVQLRGRSVPAVDARRILFPEPPNLTNETASGVLTAPLGLIALDVARTAHPLQAYYNGSMLLRHASRFDRFDERSRGRAERVRENWLSLAQQLERSRGVRQARAVIAATDPGFESPGEAIVAWCLRAILLRGELIETQYELHTGAATYFIDVALPRYRIAFEVAGYGKFGESGDSGRKVGQKLLARQQALADLGWRAINVTYEETSRLAASVQLLRQRLASLGVPTHAPAGNLWAPPTSLLQARSRRF